MAWEQHLGGVGVAGAPSAGQAPPQWSAVSLPVPTAVGRPVFAAVGLRTTGLSPGDDRIRELAVVRLDERGRFVDEWTTSLDVEEPGRGHQRPKFGEVAPTVRDALARIALVAHHVPLTTQFLRAEFTRAGWDVPVPAQIGTFEASLYYLPGLRRRSLADCCRAAGVQYLDTRTALGEARATAGLLAAFLDGRFGVRTHDDLVNAPVSAWVLPWPDRPSRAPFPPAPHLVPHPATGAIAVVQEWPPTARLVRRLSRLDLTALPDVRTANLRAYLEHVVHALESGEITRAGALSSGALATAYQLRPEDAVAVHHNLVTELARSAIHDDEYSQEERQDLYQVAAILGVAPDLVLGLIRKATPVEFPKLDEDAGSSKRPTEARGHSPKQIRAWAAQQGYQIEPHEKIPWSVVRAFEESHS